MPLQDHSRPAPGGPVAWDALHGQWPAVIIQQIRKLLPSGYAARPHVHLGSQFDVPIVLDAQPRSTQTWPAPTFSVETEMPDEDEYEVRVYDAREVMRLVAAVELVSPSNKDRPESRNAFVGKCAALLRQGVAVSIVDVVPARPANLYAELLAFLGHPGAAADDPLYAASCRWAARGGKRVLETWAHALAVGQPLPTLPLWLTPALSIPLDLETSYAAACADLAVV